MRLKPREQEDMHYMGEDTKEYDDHGKVKSTEGSWEAGVDRAQPGVVVLAQPRPGLTYREEYYKGQAEDGAAVLSLNAHAKVPYGTFDHVLQTRNETPLEPNLGGGEVLRARSRLGARDHRDRRLRPGRARELQAGLLSEALSPGA